MNSLLRIAGLSGAMILLSVDADAALVSRLNGQAVYDTDLDVTWIADANLAHSNDLGVVGIDSLGRMNWTAAQSWIAALDAANYLGANDWRLPVTTQPDPSCSAQTPVTGSPLQGSGTGCTGSEMGHLFYNELGGVAGQSIVNVHDADYDLFSNIAAGAYLSATEYVGNTTGVWGFNFGGGLQTTISKTGVAYVWAMRGGDIATVPLPAAGWLLGTGVLGLVGRATRRRWARR